MKKIKVIKYYRTGDLVLVVPKYEIDLINCEKCKAAENMIFFMQQNKNLSTNEVVKYAIISNLYEERTKLKSPYEEIEFKGGEKRVKKFRIIIGLWRILSLLLSFLYRNR